jgi:hypothetical protein
MSRRNALTGKDLERQQAKSTRRKARRHMLAPFKAFNKKLHRLEKEKSSK